MNLEDKYLIGGTSVADDIREMNSKKPHIIIGSPGRVYDLMQRGAIDTKSLHLVVMDEADELLSSGFRENVHDIFQFFKVTIQVALFSATLPEDIITLSKKFMRDPVSIIVKPDELQVEGIAQYYITLSSDYEKFEIVEKLFSTLVVSQCIIYVNSVNRVIDLYKSMLKAVRHRRITALRATIHRNKITNKLKDDEYYGGRQADRDNHRIAYVETYHNCIESETIDSETVQNNFFK